VQWFRVGIGATVGMLLIASPAASGRATEEKGAPGYVVAKSRFGNGRTRGRVRRTNLGWQVQLPGGRWVDCRRSCSETLRVETIDFWEANSGGVGQLTNECGIFGCLELKYRH
jgi:hypothetical protein